MTDKKKLQHKISGRCFPVFSKKEKNRLTQKQCKSVVLKPQSVSASAWGALTV